MNEAIKISITSLKIDDQPISIPVGLSELLTNSWVENKRPSDLSKKYKKQIMKRDGNFVTLLKKIK